MANMKSPSLCNHLRHTYVGESICGSGLVIAPAQMLGQLYARTRQLLKIKFLFMYLHKNAKQIQAFV